MELIIESKILLFLSSSIALLFGAELIYILVINKSNQGLKHCFYYKNILKLLLQYKLRNSKPRASHFFNSGVVSSSTQKLDYKIYSFILKHVI